MPMSGADFPRPVKTYHTQTYPRINAKASGFDGHGKTVFVTGGATGAGYSICRAFAEAGVKKVVIASRSAGSQKKAKDELEATYPELIVDTIQVSIDDLEAIANTLRSVGPIDVLVLSAVTAHDMSVPSKDLKLEEVQQSFHTNVIAAYHMISTYLNTPAPQEKTVLSLSSAAAHLYFPGQIAYGSSKAALSEIVSFFAGEHSPEKDGIKLISFHPGILYTGAAQEHFPEEAFQWEDIKLPGDFAVWLAGKESSFLNGRFVWAQWDVDELIAMKQKMEEDRFFLKIGLVY